MVVDHAPKNLLVIGGIGLGDPGRCLLDRFLTQSLARGCQVHMTDQELFVDLCPEEVKARFTSLTVLDFTDTARCLEWVRSRITAGERYDLVVTARDDAQPTTAAVAALLGLPYNSPRSIAVTQNKDDCRAALRAAGFRQPGLGLCADAEDARAFAADGTGPWVVKPRDGTGSRGVRRVDDVHGIEAAVAALDESDRPFVIEEFVEGDEFSAEGLFLQGAPKVVALTAKETSPAPVFVETSHVLPAPLDPPFAEEIKREVERAVAAVGLSFGLFHAEFWLTPHGIVLGEIHCRPGGDYLTLLLEEAYSGFEYFGALFDDLFLDGAATAPTPLGAAAVAFVKAAPGTVAKVEGWEDASFGADVVHAHLTHSAGETVPPLRSSMDRSGAIVVRAPSAAQAHAAATARADSVRITSL
ncbi:ATP-grasp domain-containing protein [Streptomyces sp. NPDC127039]|uniref:ATP-grasp domain-containing protein n=1 Tax=Streptomyces sp. NPDC127039 TaxID=3347115 RepID=UPI0036639F83